MDQIYEESAKFPKIKTPHLKRHDCRRVLGRVVHQGLVYLLLIGAAYGFFRFSHRYLLQTVQVDGCSMTPTLVDANCYFLNRLVFCLREPKPMDIVALQDPEVHGLAVKRVVARPGDRVYVTNGQIFVNGKLLSEPYLEPGTKTYGDPRYRSQLWICGTNQYFVLGDNRNNSADSRVYGAVPRQNIRGMVMQLDFSRWF